MAHLFYFKPIFDPSLKKVVRGPPSKVGGALVRLGDSLACVKIRGHSTPYGLKYVLPKNALWVGTIQHRDLQGHWTKLHRTCFAECRTNRHRWNDYPILNIFILFGDIHRRTLKSSEIGPNFACFSPPKCFWGVPSQNLDRHYKIGPSTDHRAKFHAGRPTHLGDLVSEEKIKTSAVNEKSFRKLSFSGGLINILVKLKKNTSDKHCSEWFVWH